MASRQVSTPQPHLWWGWAISRLHAHDLASCVSSFITIRSSLTTSVTTTHDRMRPRAEPATAFERSGRTSNDSCGTWHAWFVFWMTESWIVCLPDVHPSTSLHGSSWQQVVDFGRSLAQAETTEKTQHFARHLTSNHILCVRLPHTSSPISPRRDTSLTPPLATHYHLQPTSIRRLEICSCIPPKYSAHCFPLRNLYTTVPMRNQTKPARRSPEHSPQPPSRRSYLRAPTTAVSIVKQSISRAILLPTTSFVCYHTPVRPSHQDVTPH